jgi:uncharacterized membrane protein
VTTRVFAVLAILLGLAYVFITPPFAVPDEQSHFWRAYSIRSGHLLAKSGVDATSIDKSALNFNWVFSHPDPRETLTQTMRSAAVLPYDGKQGVVRFAAWYSPLPYLSQSIATAFPVRPIVLFYAGRIGNLITALILIALAIRAAPQYSNLFAVAALLPMSLYQLASWSADAMTIALAWLFTALLLTPPRRSWLVALAGLAMALCKPAYFLIALMAIFARMRWRERLMIIAATATGTFFAVLVASHGTYNARSELPIDARAQVRCILAQPVHFGAVLLHDLVTNGRFYVEEMIGRLGANELKLPAFVIAVELLLLLAAGLTTGIARRASVRIAALTIVLLTAGGILLSQYLIWSIVCGDVIEGVQGRYFLEILPLALIAVVPRLRSRWRLTPAAITVVAVICNGVALFTMVNRYWLV